MAAERIKFKKDLQANYDALKESNSLEEDSLYFITDMNRLFLGSNEISTPIKINGSYNDDARDTSSVVPPSNLTTDFQTEELAVDMRV